MHKDLLNAVREFFKYSRLLNKINAIFIALIPKLEYVSSLHDFRPVSLCNTVYNLFSKIIVFRLKVFLNKMIVGNQKVFVQGRHILDVAIATHEIIHSMDLSKNAGMTLKIDISKSNDKVSWLFLFVVIKKFGINGKFLKLIIACVTNLKCLVLVNGVPQGFFSYVCGLRQGDPVSPYLFIIVAEVLGINIQKSLDSKVLKGVKVASNLPPTSHQ